MIKSQSGFLSLIAILLIVIIGFLGVAVIYMLVGSTTSATLFNLSEKSLYLAEAGLEKGTRYLLTPNLTTAPSRIRCSTLSGNANLTNSALGAGAFTVTTISGSPFFANSTLSNAVTSSATTLSVASTTGFASSGRILIDNEDINYAAISGTSFIGLTRGVNNSRALSHASGARVSQYQCNLDAIGAVPNIASALAKRELRQSVQLQDAWAVGTLTSRNFVLTHWNRPTELQWTNASFTDTTNADTLNAISLLSNAEGWAVGLERNNRFTFLRLAGSTFTASPVTGACTNQDLTGVSAVSSQEAWAVGARFRVTNCNAGNYRYTVLKWNGTSWTSLSSATTPSIPADGASGVIANLNAVHVIPTATSSIGFAVGDTGTILKWNGTQWTKDTSGTTRNLTGVYVVSSSEAWAVGLNGTILKWNGSTWSTSNSTTTRQLNAITMLDTNGDGNADIGWAVGSSGMIVSYNGTSWTTLDTGNTNYLAVAAFSRNDAWTVGAGGNATHWDGSTWTSITSNVTTALNGIAVVAPGQHPASGWQEILP